MWFRIHVNDPVFRQGDKVIAMGQNLRVIDAPDPYLLVVARPGWRYHLAKFMYRVRMSLSVMFYSFIRVCAIWGLSDHEPGTTPTWKHIPIINQLWGPKWHITS